MKKLIKSIPFWRSKMDIERSFVDDMGEEFSSPCEQHFKSSAMQLTGTAGSMYLVNTLALHRGVVPTRTDRLVVWARYELGPNTNSADLERGSTLCTYRAARHASRSIRQPPPDGVRQKGVLMLRTASRSRSSI